MEKIWGDFLEDNRKLDEQIAQINNETLQSCNKILLNPDDYSHCVVESARETKEHLMKNFHKTIRNR